MKNQIFNLFFPLSLLLFGYTSNAQAYVEGDIPVEAMLYNPCCDEDIIVSGTMHLVINDNVEHLSVTDISGVGVNSGNEYTSNGVVVQNNVHYSNPVEGTLLFKANMVNDDGCSFKMKVTLHLTVLENGDVVSSVEHVTFHCF